MEATGLKTRRVTHSACEQDYFVDDSPVGTDAPGKCPECSLDLRAFVPDQCTDRHSFMDVPDADFQLWLEENGEWHDYLVEAGAKPEVTHMTARVKFALASARTDYLVAGPCVECFMFFVHAPHCSGAV